ncbi:MAG TPA: hypothetical protein VM306_04050 [Lentzea sp.]|nr:hypothetical protein [Lentzea sp.]HUQ54800.1 hypothetical protein [Lentzea sp.]
MILENPRYTGRQVWNRSSTTGHGPGGRPSGRGSGWLGSSCVIVWPSGGRALGSRASGLSMPAWLHERQATFRRRTAERLRPRRSPARGAATSTRADRWTHGSRCGRGVGRSSPRATPADSL